MYGFADLVRGSGVCQVSEIVTIKDIVCKQLKKNL